MNNNENKKNVRRYIEVCGGIASGKTSLASILSGTGIEAIYESFSTNPFFEDFYNEPTKYDFETEITFMLQHYNQINKISYDDKIRVCDYSLLLDLAYANIELSGSQLSAFTNIYHEIMKIIPKPILIIHLKCTAETEFNRIRKRGREIEKNISIEFLKKLNDSINFQLEKANSPTIIIDSDKNNYVNENVTRQKILKYISEHLRRSKVI